MKFTSIFFQESTSIFNFIKNKQLIPIILLISVENM